jgi:hypothetical protein
VSGVAVNARLRGLTASYNTVFATLAKMNVVETRRKYPERYPKVLGLKRKEETLWNTHIEEALKNGSRYMVFWRDSSYCFIYGTFLQMDLNFAGLLGILLYR